MSKWLVSAFVLALATLAAGTSRGDDVQALIAQLAKGRSTPEDRGALIAKLVDSKAAHAIEAFVSAQRRGEDEVAPLIEALSLMGTPESAGAIRKFTFNSRYTRGEVLDWEGLVRFLARGAVQSAPRTDQYLWSRLGALVRNALGFLGRPEGLPDSMKSRMVHALNTVLARREFYKAFATSLPQLNAEARELLDRHDRFYEYTPGDSLDALGLERLNRHLMDSLLAGVVAPLSAVDVTYYDPGIAAQAFEALGALGTPESTDVMLVARPLSFQGQMKHVAYLGAVARPDAVSLLGEYLTDPESTISHHAAKVLKARIGDDADGVAYALHDVAAQFRGDAERDIPERSADNVASVCLALPDRHAVGALVAILDAGTPALATAILKGLSLDPQRAGDAELLRAIDDVVKRSEDTRIAQYVLGIIKDARIRAAAATAARYLTHTDPKIQSLAAYTLRIVTKRDVRTAAQWRDVLASNPDVIAYDDASLRPQPTLAPPSASAQPEAQGMAPTTAYAIVAAVCAVLVLGLALRSRKSAPKKSGESRQGLRQALRLRVTYRFVSHVKEFAPTAKRTTTTDDLSSSGAKLTVTVPSAAFVDGLKKRQVLVALQIDTGDGSPPVQAHAVAAWLKQVSGMEYAVGIQFKEMTRSDRERIDALVLTASMT